MTVRREETQTLIEYSSEGGVGLGEEGEHKIDFLQRKSL